MQQVCSTNYSYAIYNNSATPEIVSNELFTGQQNNAISYCIF